MNPGTMSLLNRFPIPRVSAYVFRFPVHINCWSIWGAVTAGLGCEDCDYGNIPTTAATLRRTARCEGQCLSPYSGGLVFKGDAWIILGGFDATKGWLYESSIGQGITT